MISPHTPPGTKIVCIDDEPHDKFNIGPARGGLDGLKFGETYTVGAIEQCDADIDGFSVVLGEIVRAQQKGIKFSPGFSLRRFRRAELPKCLTDILVKAPTDLETV